MKRPKIPHIRRLSHLRKLGLSITAARIVVNDEFDTEFTDGQVRYFTRTYGGDMPVSLGRMSSDNGQRFKADSPFPSRPGRAEL
jgi:hypothetical protein